MHSSKYLEAWRAAVDRATREAYIRAGLTGANMPLIPRGHPVHLLVWHVVLDEQCRAEGTDEPTGSPDVDKLLRATIDGLGMARAFANDSQVVELTTRKTRANAVHAAGAIIVISDTALDRVPEGEIMTNQTVPAGEYRLVLERVVSRDAEGFPNYATMFEMTDSPEALRDTWLPAIGVRLGAVEPSPAATNDTSAAPAPATASSVRKPRKRTEPTQPAAEAPAAPTPVPTTPTPAAEPQPAAPPPAVAAAEPPRVNPFAQGLPGAP